MTAGRTTSSRQLVRKDSSPFVRKPLPRSSLTDVSTKAPRKSNTDYNSINLDGNDGSASAQQRQSAQELERHLSLTDLIFLGIGGTIGSGLFVLAGLVSHNYAGPSTVVSWAVAGAAACISGCCYAELSGRIPLPGSAYAYAFVAFGELPAVIAAACLTIEYIAAAAAVARSWGDKCVALVSEELGDDAHWLHGVLDPGGSLSPMGFVVSAGCVILLLNGVKESKRATNFFTALKIGLVSFMVLAGLFYVRPTNWRPFIPAQFGVSGIFRGATGTFFGYLGYDQVCCLAGETVNPKRDLPIAITATLISVTLLYITATFVLTGMQPWEDISPVAGFPGAFYSVGANISGEIIAVGEILTLPIVVLITIMAQPRLQYALAGDGLLPPMFGEVDKDGNLWKGTLLAGGLMVLITTVVPFERLNDMISFAVLLALSITDSSVIMLRHEAPDPESGLLEGLVLLFHAAALVAAVAITHYLGSFAGNATFFLSTGIMLSAALSIYKWCPKTEVFGGQRHRYHKEQLLTDDGYFQTPLLPFWPCLGIFVNWYLIAQLDWVGILGLLGMLGLAVLYYFSYAIHHSVGNNMGWTTTNTLSAHSEQTAAEDQSSDGSSDESTCLTRSVSLPEIHLEVGRV